MPEERIESKEYINSNIELLNKHSSTILHMKVGHAQLISRKYINDFEEAKRDQDLADPLPHIRKILTTDSRVIEINDFPKSSKSNVDPFILSEIVSDFVLPLDAEKPEKEKNRLAINIGSPLLFKLRLEPDSEQKQKWEEYYDYDATEIEECWVLWDANIFVAYKFITDYETGYFGNKARDVLTSIFRDSPIFYCGCLGPTPIHLDFISHLLQADAISKDLMKDKILELMKTAFKYEGDIYCPLVVDSADELDILKNASKKSFSWDLLLLHHWFYSVILERSALLRLQMECLNLFINVIRELKLLQQLSWYKIINKKKTCKELAVKTTQIHELLLEEYDAIGEINRDLVFLDTNYGENNCYRLLRDYFLDHIKDFQPIDREVLFSALTHVEQELDRQSTFRKDLSFAILGAIVGAALTLAGAYLNHLFDS